jgi:hypothetical protein
MEVFRIFPESGVLQPGGKQNIKVMFVPNAGKKFSQSLEFKIKSNDISKIVNVTGVSSIPKVQFNTTQISIDTTLPYKHSIHAPFTISNPNDTPIEILVAELDVEYQNEQKMLTEYNEYEDDVA